MESESYPVILRCKDVSVAIPVKTLIKESSIFKSMYESVESNSDDLPDSGRSSGNSSLEDIQTLTEKESSDVMDDCPQSKNPANVEASKAATTDAVGDTDTNIKKEKHQYTKGTSNNPQCKNEKTNHQFDTIDLSNFNARSVEILFISLKGFPEIIDACNSLTDLFGALKLCDEYGISNPIPQISSTFKTCDTISMTNLLEVMEIAENIEKMKNYDDISSGLFQRCFCYARWNFASWQIIMKLMNDEKTKAHLVVKILKELRDEPEAIIRFKVENFSTFSEAKTSSTFIFRNLSWQIEIFPNKDEMEFGINIQCRNPNNSYLWECNANVEYRMINNEALKDTVKVVEHRFTNMKEKAEIMKFNTFEAVMKPGSGFVKDDLVVFEVKIIAKKVYGVSKCLGNKDSWFAETINDETNLQKQMSISNEINLEDFIDAPVIFHNNKSIAVVDKSILIKESSVFRAMFAEHWTRSQESVDNDFIHSNIKQIKLTGYDHLSVKYLMDYLQGYPEPFKNCNSFSVICDMLKLADYYAISSTEPLLTYKILNITVGISNVVDAVRAATELGEIAAFKDLSSNLLSKGLTYLRVHLASWQVLINFAVDNRDKIDVVGKIVELLTYEKDAYIRFKSNDIKESTKCAKTPMYIHRNILWQFEFRYESNDSKTETLLSCYLNCMDTDHQNTKQTCKAEFSAHFNNKLGDSDPVVFVAYDEYEANKPGWGSFLIPKTKFLNLKNDYIKNGFVYIKFQLTADEPRGLPDSLGVTEEMIS